ncbi:MAG: MFS transporter, partial [archaeon]
SGVFSGFFGITLGPLISGFLAGVEWRLVPLLLSGYSLVVGILGRVILGGLASSHKKGHMNTVLQQIRHTAMNRNIAMLGAAGFLSFFTFQGMQPLISDMFSLPPFLMRKDEIGIILSIAGLVGILFSFAGGILADKIGFKKNMAVGFLGMLSPMFLLVLADSYWSCLILLSAMNGFSQLAMTSRNALVVDLKPEVRGTVSSISNFLVFLGFASAPIALTPIYVTLGMGWVYLTNGFLLSLCVVFTVLIRPNPRT